ncbi:MAG: tRNA uridine-5-carboxymethylaminomethyl(34) synthesis enzyme MnmG [Flavobacteriales bacterium]
MFNTDYDVIVVGGGHAGCEAAHAAAKMGEKTLLITMNMQTIAQMSCNPAMGGVAKGQIVREIDALGGLSGIVTDETMIQFKILNLSKGPAMWSPRAQSDRMRFAERWRLELEKQPNIDFWQDMVTGLNVVDGKVTGVKTQMGMSINGKSVVLTNGTFLNGVIHIGEKQFGGGRSGEHAAKGLTEDLIELGFESGRMKTGTPPRVDARSLDFSKMEEQPGDETPLKFSYTDTKRLEKQRSCYITYTNPEVHKVLESGFEKSPMFQGRIQGLGPRYCPSIEDKITRFKERVRHQLFVEPEGADTCEIYVNGFSTSLPEHVQYEALKLVPGFENVKIFKPGYAIEYDFFQPTQLKRTLETKRVENLYFAGQINGTTGYEEAGCQGLMAGINAVLKNRGEDPFVLNRNEAYIGVLIDDLVNKGTNEPYRMFTSRAEYRLLLRQDNADVRLTQKGFDLGLADQSRLDRLNEKVNYCEDLIGFLGAKSASPELMNPILEEKGSQKLRQKNKMKAVLSRPHVSISDLRIMPDLEAYFEKKGYDREGVELAEIRIKYEGYLKRERENAQKLIKLERIKIPEHYDYKTINSLSSEAVLKLSDIRPSTIGQASRISGVSPSDISILLVYMGR